MMLFGALTYTVFYSLLNAATNVGIVRQTKQPLYRVVFYTQTKKKRYKKIGSSKLIQQN